MRKIGTPILHIVRLGHNVRSGHSVRSGHNVRSGFGVLPGFAVLLGLTILPGLTACGGPDDPNLYWDVLDADGTWLGRQPTSGVARYFGRDTCYVTEDREEGSVVVRYRLVPAF